MKKEGNCVMMEAAEYERIQRELKELRKALVIATRGKEAKSGDLLLSMRTFYNITQEILSCDDNGKVNMEEDIYGHDVTVHFHGMYCNCMDGASVYNSVIEAVKECSEEEED